MNQLNEALFKDLVKSTTFKRNGSTQKNSIRNPLNIIWMLEHCDTLPKKAQEYLDKLKIKEHEFNQNSSRTTSGIILDLLIEEDLFLKRFDSLVNQIDSLTPYTLSIIDLKSVKVLEHAIKCGLDINTKVNDTYPLQHAIDTKNTTITNYLYGLLTIDKLQGDHNNNNLAHIVAFNKNYNLIDSLSKEKLDLFYVKNNKNQTAIDIIFKYKQYATLPNKHKLSLTENILMFINLHHTGKYLLSTETLNIIETSTVLKDIWVESQYQRLDNLVERKDDNKIVKKVRKI